MSSKKIQASIWVAWLAALGALVAPLACGHLTRVMATNVNSTLSVVRSNSTAGVERAARSISSPSKPVVVVVKRSASMGDSIGLETALSARDEMMPAAGEHKKYMLVKKKPKHKKIKMEVYKPKMKYKKIKMKVPVKKLKKKKVKGYLVKKEKHYH